MGEMINKTLQERTQMEPRFGEKLRLGSCVFQKDQIALVPPGDAGPNSTPEHALWMGLGLSMWGKYWLLKRSPPLVHYSTFPPFETHFF